MKLQNLIPMALCAISLTCATFASTPTSTRHITIKNGLTSQTLTLTGSLTYNTDSNGNVTVYAPNGVVLFEAAQPIPIVVVGVSSKKVTGPNINVQANPNHVSLTGSGSGTTDAKVSGPSWSVEATGVATTITGV